MFLDRGGNRSTWSKPTRTRGEHTNSTQERLDSDSNQGPSCCEVTALTQSQMKIKKLHKFIIIGWVFTPSNPKIAHYLMLLR